MKKAMKYATLSLITLSVVATGIAAHLGIGGCPLCWGRKIVAFVSFWK